LDNNAVSANSVAKHYRLSGSRLQEQYKQHLSDYKQWDQLSHAEDWILYPENMGTTLCIDEVALSKGELYTVVSNPTARTQKGSLVAMVKGTKSDQVCKILRKIPLKTRQLAQQVCTDLASTMQLIAKTCFTKAALVSDRFHVQQLVSNALQELRIDYRWQAIKAQNQKHKEAKANGQTYQPEVFANGDTAKQLLARSRYLLFKTSNKWTDKQKQRAAILFAHYPDLKKAYHLSINFRSIYEQAKTKREALTKLEQWYSKVESSQFDCFDIAAQSVKNHQTEILNYFISRTSNGLAENLNGKIKAFRAIFRGVSDIPFFLYRVSMIFS